MSFSLLLRGLMKINICTVTTDLIENATRVEGSAWDGLYVVVVVVLFEALDLVMLVVFTVVAVAAVPALDGEVADPALRLPPAIELHHLQVAQDVGLGRHPVNIGG